MNYQGYFKIEDQKDNVLYLRNDFEIISIRKYSHENEIYLTFSINSSEEGFSVNEEEFERILHYIRTRDNIKDF